MQRPTDPLHLYPGSMIQEMHFSSQYPNHIWQFLSGRHQQTKLLSEKLVKYCKWQSVSFTTFLLSFLLTTVIAEKNYWSNTIFFQEILMWFNVYSEIWISWQIFPSTNVDALRDHSVGKSNNIPPILTACQCHCSTLLKDMTNTHYTKSLSWANNLFHIF